MPLDVKVTVEEVSALEFTWKDLECGTRYGDIRYRYELRLSGSTNFIKAGETNLLSARLTGLDVNTDYEFQVAAISSVRHQGPFSRSVMARTKGRVKCALKQLGMFGCVGGGGGKGVVYSDYPHQFLGRILIFVAYP